uniref:Uncharacterized protein n=1 Tax=Noctiluca scintillans TaxID=2966 RepID=A0A7S1F3X8_NOCSC
MAQVSPLSSSPDGHHSPVVCSALILHLVGKAFAMPPKGLRQPFAWNLNAKPFVPANAVSESFSNRARPAALEGQAEVGLATYGNGGSSSRSMNAVSLARSPDSCTVRSEFAAVDARHGVSQAQWRGHGAGRPRDARKAAAVTRAPEGFEEDGDVLALLGSALLEAFATDAQSCSSTGSDRSIRDPLADCEWLSSGSSSRGDETTKCEFGRGIVGLQAAEKLSKGGASTWCSPPDWVQKGGSSLENGPLCFLRPETDVIARCPPPPFPPPPPGMSTDSGVRWPPLQNFGSLPATQTSWAQSLSDRGSGTAGS